MSKLDSDKGNKLNLYAIILHSFLLVPFCLMGCGDKSPQPGDSKSIKIEISAPNEARNGSNENLKNAGISSIDGIKAGDPINRVSIIFGLDEWKPFSPEGSNFTDLYVGHYFQTIDLKHIYKKGEGTLNLFFIKDKKNTIKAVTCIFNPKTAVFFDDNGTVGETHFSTNASKCNGGDTKIFNPIFQATTFPNGKNINQQLGEPLSAQRVTAKEIDIFNSHLKYALKATAEDIASLGITRLEYKNSYIFAFHDRVIGMSIFDDDIMSLNKTIENRPSKAR